MSLWVNIKRVSKYGLISFVRNGFVSFAAVLIMTITLFVVASLIISSAALKDTLKQLTQKVDVTVYFTVDANAEQITSLQKALEILPEVDSVTYMSREDALAIFRKRHKGDQLTLQALEELGLNPLGASLEIHAKQISQYESIAKFLEAHQDIAGAGASGIEKVNFYQNKTTIDRLTNIVETSRRIGMVVAIILGFATVLIAFNTIRLTIYMAREEIVVMNLVGAGHWYVRGPFMISGMLYGVVSGLLVLLSLYPLTLWLGPKSERFFGSFNVSTYFLDAFPVLFLIIIGFGIALGALASFLAVRRYLHA